MAEFGAASLFVVYANSGQRSGIWPVNSSIPDSATVFVRLCTLGTEIRISLIYIEACEASCLLTHPQQSFSIGKKRKEKRKKTLTTTIANKMDALRRKQARAHIKFSNLRHGFLHEGSDRQAEALLDDTQSQPWRHRPPRQAWPRDPGFVYPPRGVTMQDLAEFVGERTLLTSIPSRVTLDDKTMRQGRTTVNQAARRLAEVVCYVYDLLSSPGGEGVC